MYLTDFYFYFVYLIVLYIFYAITRDRKLLPARSSGVLLLLSSLLAFFGSYLFIRSLVSGHRYGSGTCGPEGCVYSQPLLFTIDDILFVLTFPLMLLTAILALLMVLGQIQGIKNGRAEFDGAGVVLAGSMLFVFSIIGGYPGLQNLVTGMFLMITLLLLAKTRRYRYILCAVAITYLYPLLLW